MIKLLHGDCLELMKDIPDGSVDLTVTSPPYDNLRTYNNTLEWGEHVWKPVLQELFRVTKKGGVVVWIVNDATIKGSETGTSFRQALYAKEIGFNLHDTMIWEKKDSIPQVKQKRYWNCFEYMFILSKGQPKIFNGIMVQAKTAGKKRNDTLKQITTGKQVRIQKEWVTAKERIKKNIWTIATATAKEINGHTAVFPEQLANDHIISWSNENDIIFDPFLGSGTTGKMAVLNNRNFIGIEKDETYFNIAKKRIEEAEKSINEKLFI
jgi:site-specific DNA-methyltransferase (adenine-specific)